MSSASTRIVTCILIQANSDLPTKRHHFADLRKKLTIPDGGAKIPVAQLQSFVRDNPTAVLSCVVREDGIHTFVDSTNRNQIAFELNVCVTCLRACEYESPDRVRRLTQLVDSARMIRKLIEPTSPQAKLACELFDDRVEKIRDLVD